MANHVRPLAHPRGHKSLHDVMLTPDHKQLYANWFVVSRDCKHVIKYRYIDLESFLNATYFIQLYSTGYCFFSNVSHISGIFFQSTFMEKGRGFNPNLFSINPITLLIKKYTLTYSWW